MHPPPRVRPPGAADERAQLGGWLDLQRSLVHHKCEGLGEDDAHRALLPTSPLMTVAGLVSHLRWVEHCWFEVLFLDRPAAPNPQFGQEGDADFRVEGVPLARLLDEYARQCAVSNGIVAAASLDDRGRNGQYGADALSLRWILGHMVEEVARHVGHLDLLREMLDGRTGYY
ncbi:MULTISPECIES: DinB family protein [unclassified Blastococcus]